LKEYLGPLAHEKGFHYTDEGIELIELIRNQMNNRRLSTINYSINNRELVVDREVILSKINKLLNGPSNFELKEDRQIFIKSLGRNYHNNIPVTIQMLDENGNLVKNWDSLTSCAYSLRMSKGGIQYRIKSSKRFEYEGKTVYLKEIKPNYNNNNNSSEMQPS